MYLRWVNSLFQVNGHFIVNKNKILSSDERKNPWSNVKNGKCAKQIRKKPIRDQN